MRGALRSLTILGSGWLVAACGVDAQVRRELDDQQARLRAMSEAYEAQNKQLQGLRGRIEVLEDQLEAAKVHGGTARALPVVKLAPPPAADADGEPGPERSSEEDGGGYVISQADVEAMDPERAFRPSGGRGPVPPPENAAFAGNIGVAPLPGAARVQASPREEQDTAINAYKATYAQYKAGDLASAIRGFLQFAERYPDHSYSDNALYLVGQARFDRAELAAALEAFRRVVDRYPSGNKVPDALLMIGLTLERLGRPAEGKETLSRLVAMFPNTEAAQRAQATLRGGRM